MDLKAVANKLYELVIPHVPEWDADFVIGAHIMEAWETVANSSASLAHYYGIAVPEDLILRLTELTGWSSSPNPVTI